MADKARILIVDDEPKICDFLETLLRREGYETTSAGQAADALASISKSDYDLIVTDLRMPGMDGFELVRRIKDVRRDLPVVMITGYATVETAVQALRHGVDDYVTKPFNVDEMRKVIARALRASDAERETREIQERCVAVLKALTARLEARDPYMNGHSRRVGDYACELGKAAGASAEEIALLRTAADLHDIGKTVVNDAILEKPSELNAGERDLIRGHPELGEKLVEPLGFLASARPVIRHHHERVDGSGYPDGLKGEAIPRLARMLTIADAYDAMTTERPWRPALSPEEAGREIRSCAGKQFDPALAETFRGKVLQQFKA